MQIYLYELCVNCAIIIMNYKHSINIELGNLAKHHYYLKKRKYFNMALESVQIFFDLGIFFCLYFCHSFVFFASFHSLG